MDRPLTVLIAAHIRWYNAEAECAHRLARGLRARGHRVLVWGRPGSPLLEKAAALGIPVIDTQDPGSLDPAAMAGATRLVSRLVREAGVEVVNAIRSEGYPIVARAARRAGAAVVRTRADMRPPKFAAVNRLIHERWTGQVITANDLIRDELIIRLQLPPERVHTVHFGIDPNEIRREASLADLRAELGVDPDAPVVGVMGRLGKVKGHEYALKAAEKVVKAVPAVRFLVLYRDVEDSDKFLPALAKSPVRDRFILAGPRPGHQRIMQLAQVAAIPSVGSEAHCRVALEWMALGVPLIGSRVGVIPEIVDHGVTGFLVQPRYSDTIARCLIDLLSDPARARAMGEAGRQRLIERFSEDQMVEGSLAVFRRALGQGSSVSR